MEDKGNQFILNFLLNCGEEFKARAVMNTALKARPELTGYISGGRCNVDQRHIPGDHTSKSFQERYSPTTVLGQRQRSRLALDGCAVLV